LSEAYISWSSSLWSFLHVHLVYHWLSQNIETGNSIYS
jgi:hypothetical protein